ncbi:MAG TPA: SpoIIE family protein phosphatase [Trebonia sp.]
MPAARGDGDAAGPRSQAGDALSVADAFESMPSLMAAMEGPEHTVVAANAALRAFTRQPDLIGRPGQYLFPGLVSRQVTELLDLVYAGGEPFTAREWPAGDDQYLDFTLTPWLSAAGEVRGVLMTQPDVAELARDQAAAPSRARREALAVQEVMLRPGLPVLPSARVAARYLPAAAQDNAGGDCFDAMVLPDGQVAVMVADAPGRGLAASAAIWQLRTVLGDALNQEASLPAVLVRADRFAAGNADLRAATLCVAVLEPAGGRLCYATCGHPPPLVAAPDGTARHLPATGGRPLGICPVPAGDGAGRRAEIGTAVLGPGEVLLLYTNGLVKRPARTLGDGMADLEVVAGDAAANPALAARGAGTPAERVSYLTVELLTRGGFHDDVTTLAVWRQPEPHPPLDVELTASPDAVPGLRHALDDWLDALGVAFGDRQLAELSAIEAVTNAVEHAYPAARPGTVRLQAAVGADGYLEIRVSDRGRWRVPDVTEADRGQGLSAAVQFAEGLRVSHPPQNAGEPPGARGTVVTTRHRLHRQPMLAPLGASVPAERAARPSFAVQLTASGPAPRVQVSGPVDVTTADRLADWLFQACRAGVLPLTVDLSAVTILASAGVHVLHRVAAQLAVHGQQLTLVSEAGSPATAVLDLARLPRQG